MSYEFCVFRADYASRAEAAGELWNSEDYITRSTPHSQRDAPKWQTKDALLAFNPALALEMPADTRGILDRLKGADVAARYISVHTEPGAYRDQTQGTGREAIYFHIYDHAIEVSLPWNTTRDAVQAHVREVWRYLEHLAQLGWNVIYDTERDAVLDLAADFDVVVRGYIENLNLDDGTVAPAATQTADAPMPTAQPQASAPFTGNVGEAKPWWKIW